MDWIKTQPADSFFYWVSGIYKVVHYVGPRRGYHAYMIMPNQKNWGDHVQRGDYVDPLIHVRCFQTLKQAQAACEAHASAYTPNPDQIHWAKKSLAKILEQEAQRVQDRGPA